MKQDMIFEPSADLAKSALIDADGYAALYQESIANPDQFWSEQGKRIDWILHSDDFVTLNAAINYTQEAGRFPSDHYPVEATVRLK